MELAEASGGAEPEAPPFAPTIPAMLHQIAEWYGDRQAQISHGEAMSYRELEARSAAMARGLLAMGLGKGARVALLMPNGLEFTVAFMAVARIGALVAPLSTLYQAPELAWVLNHADIQLLITADRYLRHDYLARLEQALPSLSAQATGDLVLPEAPYLRSILVFGRCDRPWAREAPAALAAAAAAKPRIDAAFLAAVEASVVPADLFCMIHTSGSTAQPKGVVHSHGAVIRHSWQKVGRFWGLDGSDRMISPRPLFWVAGLAATFFHNLMSGCTLIFPEDQSAEMVIRLIETEGATALCGEAGWLRAVRLDPAMAAAGYQVFRLTNDTAAIAAIADSGPRFLNPERARRTPAPTPIPDPLICRSYGMTETVSAHTMLPADQFLEPHQTGACGRPLPGITLKIVDEVTRETLGPNQVGEALVRGYSLMQGLYKREPAEVFTPDGFYATGDAGSFDDDGFFVFSHRLGEMLKIHGANVAPAEVENTLNTLDQIERSAVVGLPAADGLMLAAAVQVRRSQSFDEAEIREALKSRLSSFKVPRRIFALEPEEFPVTGSGKIRKPDLIPLLAARVQAESAEA